MYTQNVETIEPFSSCVMPVKAVKACMGECINIMVQALQTEDGSLLQCLMVQNTYTELRQGSKKPVMVVRNNTAYSQTLWKKTPVARAVVALPVPEPPEEEQLLEGADLHTPRLTVRQRHGKLFDELDLSGLDSWAPELADAAHWLLAKYHDMFSLDPAELGCTLSTEHMIKVMDDTPFKEQFRCISLHHWLKRFRTTCKKCWSLVLSGPARALGATQWCWCGKRTVVYSFVSTFATWMLAWKRTPT